MELSNQSHTVGIIVIIIMFTMKDRRVYVIAENLSCPSRNVRFFNHVLCWNVPAPSAVLNSNLESFASRTDRRKTTFLCFGCGTFVYA